MEYPRYKCEWSMERHNICFLSTSVGVDLILIGIVVYVFVQRFTKGDDMGEDAI